MGANLTRVKWKSLLISVSMAGKAADVKVFLVGFTWICLVMVLSFASPQYSIFRVHDFLDHIVTLSWLVANPDLRFHPGVKLPLLFGGDVVPVGALGFSDFSVSHILYFLLPLELAPVASEVLGRLLAFVGVFLLFRALCGSRAEPSFGALISGITLALMPYWPTMTWTLVALVFTTYSLVLLRRTGRHWGAYVLLVLSPFVGFFAWGGFLIPGMALAFFVSRWRARAGALRYGAAFLVTTASSGLSAWGLIRTWFDGDFVSHRSAWSVEYGLSSLDLDWIGAALTSLGRTFLAGQYHYGTFFSWSPNATWETVNTLVLLMGLFAGPVLVFQRGRGSLAIHAEGAARAHSFAGLAIWLLAFQAAVSLVYVAETSGLVSLASLLGVPFQFSRVVAFSPILWALLAGVSYSMFEAVLPARRRGATALLALSLVTLQGFVVNPSIGGFVRELVPNLDNMGAVSVRGYFQQDSYQAVANRLGGSETPPTALSIGLDPMVAVAAGIPSLDGYVYNFPLSYKESFRDLLITSPLVSPSDLESFDSWGSRLYLPSGTGQALSPDIDWCLAKTMGADVVLSASRDLRSKGLTYLFSEGPVHVFDISPSCAPFPKAQ